MKESEKQSRILEREKLIEEVKKLTLFDDVFMSAVLEDIPACQHVLRILTGISDLNIRTVKSQYHITKLVSKRSRLDIFAESTDNQIYIIEVQKEDKGNHSKRVRYYRAMADSELLRRGESYEKIPKCSLFYISETDIWNRGSTVYPIYKYLGNTGEEYEDGQHIIFVNAEVDDYTEIAELMKYFKTADPEDDSQGALSKRVKFLKGEKKGLDIMSNFGERMEKRGEERGEKRAERRLILGLLKAGAEISLIKEASGLSEEEIEEISKKSEFQEI